MTDRLVPVADLHLPVSEVDGEFTRPQTVVVDGDTLIKSGAVVISNGFERWELMVWNLRLQAARFMSTVCRCRLTRVLRLCRNCR